MKPWAQYKTNGELWRAGKDIFGLCCAWNHATKPSRMLSDNEHRASFRYARAIKNRMRRLGFVYGLDYIELSNSDLWPKPYRETLHR
jgi:hypothetical protein